MCNNSGCVRYYYYGNNFNDLNCRFLWAFFPSCLSDFHFKFKSVVKCAYFVKDLQQMAGYIPLKKRDLVWASLKPEW